MRIEGLKKYRNRPSIDDLPEPLRTAAREWLGRLLHNRIVSGQPTPQTTLALLVGQAKRLALTTPEQRSAWGRSMLAKKGGYAVQGRYQVEGRVGRAHPAHLAAAVSASRRRWKKKVEDRKKLGITPRRCRFNLDGI